MLKRTLAIVLALVMIIGLLPILPASTTAFAAESGTCGANMTWSLDNAGTLTITGYGKMDNYNYESPPPWHSQRANIRKITFTNTGSGITSIGSAAFSSLQNLTNVSLPETLESVGNSAFYYSEKLKDFSLPESVTTIDACAFGYCKSLTKVPSASKLKNVTSLGAAAFMNCEKIKEAVIPPSITSIPMALYTYCTGLESVVIPENVTNIEMSAFSDCTSLDTVVLNAGVTEVEDQAFSNCSALANVFVSNPLKMGAKAFDGCPTSAYFHIEPSESEFNSKSTIDSDNTAFNSAAHTYNTLFAIVQHPNGGTGGYFGEAGEPIIGWKEASAADYTISSEKDAIPAREGFTFTGWNTKPDGKGKDYQPGSKYTENAVLNLYARWEDETQPQERVNRLSGSSRNGTAVEISKEVERSLGKCKAVVLANGWDFADALAGGPLAKALGASILLITGDDNDQATYAEIARLGVKDVYILGGKVAVSTSVETQLKQNDYNVERIAGSTRFETAVLIAEKMDSLRGNSGKNAFFAYSHNYPDALAVSGVAASMSSPILYIGSSGMLDPATKAYVEKCELNESYILGGTGAINGAAENNIKNAGSNKVFRIAGSTRYETCLEINKAFSDKLVGSTICVSTGVNFPDALAGSVLAAENQAPMVLVAPDEPLSAAQKEYIEEFYPGSYGYVYIFGGKVAIPEAIETELKTLVP